MTTTMQFLVFIGSMRDSTPPRPARLGLRVARAVAAQLAGMGHGVHLVDPLEPALAAATGPVFKPHFAYAAGSVPSALEALAGQIAAADGHIMVSPEYNHSMSPALAHLLNHFGSGLFGYRPSLIATYSAGQWGGARAAVPMRAFLSELGCLPVSAMLHMPRAQDVLQDNGTMMEGADAAQWHSYIGRGLEQLVWWATAARQLREAADAPHRPGAFTRSPSERNAPG